MKKLLFSLALTLSLLNLAAQRSYVPTSQELTTFKNSKTYVVLVSNMMSEYNMQIRNAVEKHWKITPFEFIQMSEFEDRSRDTTASFLYVSTLSYERDRTNTRYEYLCLSLGGDHFSLGEIKDIANIPLSYYGVEEDRYTYKLSGLVQFLQAHVEKMEDLRIPLTSSLYSQYNKNMPELKKKVLYIVGEDLSREIDTREEIAAIYPGEFKIVELEEAGEIMLSGDPKAVILHKVGPRDGQKGARVYKILLGVGDATIYSYDSHKISPKSPDAFLAKDLKKLARSITQ